MSCFNFRDIITYYLNDINVELRVMLEAKKF